MSEVGFIDKFGHKSMKLVLARLINEPDLVDRFKHSLHPEDFYVKEKTEVRKAYSEIISILKQKCNDGTIKSVDMRGIAAELNKYPDGDFKNTLAKVITDIRNVPVEDYRSDHVLQVFLEGVKISEILKWFEGDFKPKINVQNASGAAKSMEDFLDKVSRLSVKHTEPFDFDSLEKLFEPKEEKIDDYLSFFPAFDSEMENGFQKGTLSGFMAVSGGGKSMMTSQLVALCVNQKMHAHVVSVEENERTFSSRIVGAISGIPTQKLLKGYKFLNDAEKEAFRKAKEGLKEYITLEFIYDQPLSEIHRIKTEAIERRIKHEPSRMYAIDILDYSGHLATSCAGDKTHEKMLEAYKERKNFALKHHVIAFDFVQPNRDGTKKNNDSGILKSTDIAGGFDIIRVFDNLISINRGPDQVVKNEAVLYMDKIRNGSLKGKKFNVDRKSVV